MDLLQVAKLINTKINDIEKQRNKLEALAIEKARLESEYDKQLSISIIKLKMGDSVEVDGHKITNPPVTILEKVARGSVWKEKFEYSKAEALYKAAVSNINALESQLNGYQSINRYLKEI